MPSRRFTIDDLEPWIEVWFDRSSGPGGQNVNKVATRATLAFDFRACTLLSEVEAERIARRLATRRTHDGRLRVVAQSARTQAANRALAEERLLDLLTEALHVPRKRRPTRPSAASRRRRLDDKTRRGETKRRRQSRPSPND